MKTILKQLFRSVGLDVRRSTRSQSVGAHPKLPRLDMRAHLSHVASLGFRPGTVIDVGAAEGTPPLLDVFPESFHLLIEPLAEFEPQLRAVAARLNGQYRIAAANDDGNPVTLNVHTGHLHGSSILKEEMGAAVDGFERTVPGVRLDDLWAELHLRGPALLKVDVQGAELTVLRGANKVLESTELVILETSFFHFMRTGPTFDEVIRFMSARGFAPYDLFGLSYRPLDGALGQVDIAFVRSDGLLRRTHRWS